MSARRSTRSASARNWYAASAPNSAVSIFKDTTLVTVVSMYELTGALSLALAGDPEWRTFHLEAYLFIGLIYWTGCYAMSRFSRGIGSKVGAGGTAA